MIPGRDVYLCTHPFCVLRPTYPTPVAHNDHMISDVSVHAQVLIYFQIPNTVSKNLVPVVTYRTLSILLLLNFGLCNTSSAMLRFQQFPLGTGRSSLDRHVETTENC